MATFRHKGLTIRISDNMAELGLMPSGVLQNQGNFLRKLELTNESEQINSEELFFVEGQGYKFRLWIEKGRVYMQRNDFVLKRRIRSVTKVHYLMAGWGPNKFYLASHSDLDFNNTMAMVETETKDIYVPLKLYKWAHECSLLLVEKFSTLSHFSSIVMENIKQAEKRISESNSFTSFWDYHRGDVPKPKDEPQAVKAFVALMRDRAVVQGYELVQEPQAGTGALDVLAIGALSSGELVKIAIEGKNAHSADLMHGLNHQLPSYMRATGADRGIYLVLWYKCEKFQMPNRKQIDLHVDLAENQTQKEITVNFVDVSLSVTPSKRQHMYS